MSYNFNKRKGNLRKKAGKKKNQCSWILKSVTYKNTKGKEKTGYKVIRST